MDERTPLAAPEGSRSTAGSWADSRATAGKRATAGPTGADVSVAESLASLLVDARAAIGIVSVRLEELSASALSPDDLRSLTSQARSTARMLDTLEVSIARSATALAAEGRSGTASETLLNQGEVSAAAARRQAARADVADALPDLGRALAAGAVGGEHLDAVARASKGLSDDEARQLAACGSALADAAASMPVDTFNQHVRATVDGIRNDHGQRNADDQRAQSGVRLWKNNDGMGQIRGCLDGERFDALRSALDAEMASLAATMTRDTGTPTAKNDNLTAAALCSLVGAGNGAPGRAHIIVVADHETLANGPHEASLLETQDGTPLPPIAVERLCCDATLQRVRLDERGVPIDVGRLHRTATPGQWSALRARYRTCAFAQCDRPISWTQAHHVRYWHPDGQTDLGNLVPLCSHHHHAVHEGGWTLHLGADRALTISRPDGSHHATTWPDRPHRARPRASGSPPGRLTAKRAETGTAGRSDPATGPPK